MKKNKRRIILLSLLLSVCTSTYAKWYNIRDRSVSLDIPKNWEMLPKNTLGIPLTWISPLKKASQKKASRMVVEAMMVGIDSKIFNIDNAEEVYREKKFRWIKKNLGSLKSFTPMKTIISDQGKLKISALGAKYKIFNKDYDENSYYLICNHRVFHLKSLRRTDNFPEGAPQLEKIIKSFRCQDLRGVK